MTTIAISEQANKQIHKNPLKMSYQAYLQFASDSQIVEWVNGEVITYMPPAHTHQDDSRFLSNLLDLFIRFFDLGILCYAPFEVKLWPDGPSREPDIFFIANENLSKLTQKRFEGGPDLIIEIISPSSVTEDRVHKFNHYQQANVKEYWIIDPRPHQQQADFYVLSDDGTYHSAPVDDNGLYHSVVLPHFWLNLAWLWQNPLPNPQFVFAEIMMSLEILSSEEKETYKTVYNMLKKRMNKQISK